MKLIPTAKSKLFLIFSRSYMTTPVLNPFPNSSLETFSFSNASLSRKPRRIDRLFFELRIRTCVWLNKVFFLIRHWTVHVKNYYKKVRKLFVHKSEQMIMSFCVKIELKKNRSLSLCWGQGAFAWSSQNTFCTSQTARTKQSFAKCFFVGGFVYLWYTSLEAILYMKDLSNSLVQLAQRSLA